MSISEHMSMYLIAKRAMDILVSASMMAALSPLFLMLIILIKLDSRGPVFYMQRRNGLGGKPFSMHKFRTMVVNADELKSGLVNEVDGPMFKVKGDPRVTRVGRALRKWSIDEVPQLYNVLIGEMSLVGPRPLAMEEMKGHEAWKEARLSVKPGVTGLWQVKGRATHKFDEWIRYDAEYVENRSFWMDFKILLLTMGAVVRRRDED